MSEHQHKLKALTTEEIALAERYPNIVALIGRTVQWQRVDGTRYWACCPFHNEKTASFKVEDGRRIYKCFGCGKGGNAIRWMMVQYGMTFPDAVRELNGDAVSSVRSSDTAPEPADKGANQHKDRLRPATAPPTLTDAWKKTWRNSTALRGTVGETYLIRRVGKKMEWPEDLRFNPECWRNVDDKLEKHPAIVALVRNIKTNEPQAVQRIFLRADGSDRLRDNDARKFTGPKADGAIKLTPDEDVTLGLGLVEGIEKGLWLMARDVRPIWTTCGTAGLAAFPVLEGIDALVVYADNDENRQGEIAAAKCITRWREAGLEARGIKPRAVKDWDAVEWCAA